MREAVHDHRAVLAMIRGSLTGLNRGAEVARSQGATPYDRVPYSLDRDTFMTAQAALQAVLRGGKEIVEALGLF
jgi:hypothetical protein